jgi:uncharacterized protein (DUF885 family)
MSYPGHHLQFSVAFDFGGRYAARLMNDRRFSEGWALY